MNLVWTENKSNNSSKYVSSVCWHYCRTCNCKTEFLLRCRDRLTVIIRDTSKTKVYFNFLLSFRNAFVLHDQGLFVLEIDFNNVLPWAVRFVLKQKQTLPLPHQLYQLKYQKIDLIFCPFWSHLAKPLCVKTMTTLSPQSQTVNSVHIYIL